MGWHFRSRRKRTKASSSIETPAQTQTTAAEPEALPGDTHAVPQHHHHHHHHQQQQTTLDMTPPQSRREMVLPACPLAVTVSIRFTDTGVRSVYKREYRSSPNFDPTERICRGLLRRIEHGCEEVITRKDSRALETHDQHHSKPLRFEMTLKLTRHGREVWAERSFKSFQKATITHHAAKEFAAATHRLVGLFLLRHDRDFFWTGDPLKDHYQESSEITAKPTLDGPLSLNCIPRARFNESTQSFEFIPGFTIELSFKSRSQRRKQHDWRKILRITSRQSTPLNLGCAENLMWQASKAINSVIDLRKDEFDTSHRKCELLEGAARCYHFEQEALDLELRILNNLGPGYDHLHRSIRSRLALFSDEDGADCEKFLEVLHMDLAGARDRIDEQLSQMKDFDFRILNLSGQGWEAKEPARFTFDHSLSHSRRSIEAVLDRVQTGVVDVLRGNDMAVHLGAYKRGHHILDKALIARPPMGVPRQIPEDPELQKKTIISQLRARIQEDLDMICRDTCSLEDIPEDKPLDLEEAVDEEAMPDVLEMPGEQYVPVERSGEPAMEILTPPATPPGPRCFPLVPAKYRPDTMSSFASSQISEVLGTSVRTTITEAAPAVAVEARLDAEPISQSADADFATPTLVRDFCLPISVDETAGQALQSDNSDEAMFVTKDSDPVAPEVDTSTALRSDKTEVEAPVPSNVVPEHTYESQAEIEARQEPVEVDSPPAETTSDLLSEPAVVTTKSLEQGVAQEVSAKEVALPEASEASGSEAQFFSAITPEEFGAPQAKADNPSTEIVTAAETQSDLSSGSSNSFKESPESLTAQEVAAWQVILPEASESEEQSLSAAKAEEISVPEQQVEEQSIDVLATAGTESGLSSEARASFTQPPKSLTVQGDEDLQVALPESSESEEQFFFAVDTEEPSVLQPEVELSGETSNEALYVADTEAELSSEASIPPTDLHELFDIWEDEAMQAALPEASESEEQFFAAVQDEQPQETIEENLAEMDHRGIDEDVVPEFVDDAGLDSEIPAIVKAIATDENPLHEPLELTEISTETKQSDSVVEPLQERVKDTAVQPATASMLELVASATPQTHAEVSAEEQPPDNDKEVLQDTVEDSAPESDATSIIEVVSMEAEPVIELPQEDVEVPLEPEQREMNDEVSQESIDQAASKIDLDATVEVPSVDEMLIEVSEGEALEKQVDEVDAVSPPYQEVEHSQLEIIVSDTPLITVPDQIEGVDDISQENESPDNLADASQESTDFVEPVAISNVLEPEVVTEISSEQDDTYEAMLEEEPAVEAPLLEAPALEDSFATNDCSEVIDERVGESVQPADDVEVGTETELAEAELCEEPIEHVSIIDEVSVPEMPVFLAEDLPGHAHTNNAEAELTLESNMSISNESVADANQQGVQDTVQPVQEDPSDGPEVEVGTVVDSKTDDAVDPAVESVELPQGFTEAEELVLSEMPESSGRPHTPLQPSYIAQSTGSEGSPVSSAEADNDNASLAPSTPCLSVGDDISPDTSLLVTPITFRKPGTDHMADPTGKFACEGERSEPEPQKQVLADSEDLSLPKELPDGTLIPEVASGNPIGLLTLVDIQKVDGQDFLGADSLSKTAGTDGPVDIPAFEDDFSRTKSDYAFDPEADLFSEESEEDAIPAREENEALAGSEPWGEVADRFERHTASPSPEPTLDRRSEIACNVNGPEAALSIIEDSEGPESPTMIPSQDNLPTFLDEVEELVGPHLTDEPAIILDKEDSPVPTPAEPEVSEASYFDLATEDLQEAGIEASPVSPSPLPVTTATSSVPESSPEPFVTEHPPSPKASLPETDSVSSLEFQANELSLLPPATRTLTTKSSTSSTWENCSSSSINILPPRDSVDTIHSILAPLPPRRPSINERHATTGYVGLHESRLVEFGLRGALTGSRRFDVTAIRPMTASAVEGARPVTSSSASSSGQTRTLRLRRRARSVSRGLPKVSLPKRKHGGARSEAPPSPRPVTAPAVHAEEARAKQPEPEQEAESASVLPRMMRMFSGFRGRY